MNIGVGHGLGLPHMDIQIMFGKVKTFCPLTPTHPPFIFVVTPTYGTFVLVQGGPIFNNYEII